MVERLPYVLVVLLLCLSTRRVSLSARRVCNALIQVINRVQRVKILVTVTNPMKIH